jgi:hypothetical protein
MLEGKKPEWLWNRWEQPREKYAEKLGESIIKSSLLSSEQTDEQEVFRGILSYFQDIRYPN